MDVTPKVSPNCNRFGEILRVHWIFADRRGGTISQGGDSLPAAIRDPIDALMRDIAQLHGEVARLGRENEALRAERGALQTENGALRGENGALRAKNRALRARTRRWGRKRRPAAPTGPGQLDKLEAVVQRRVEEEAAIPGSLHGRSARKAAGRWDIRATRSGRLRRPIGSTT